MSEVTINDPMMFARVGVLEDGLERVRRLTTQQPPQESGLTVIQRLSKAAFSHSLRSRLVDAENRVDHEFLGLQQYIAGSDRTLPLGIPVTAAISSDGQISFRYGTIVSIDAVRIPVIFQSTALQIAPTPVDGGPLLQLTPNIHPRLHLPTGYMIPVTGNLLENPWLTQVHGLWEPTGITDYSHVLPPKNLAFTNRPELVTPTRGFDTSTALRNPFALQLYGYLEFYDQFCDTPATVTYKRLQD